MIVKNGHKWQTLEDDIFTAIKNQKKKVVAVYAGNKLIYPISNPAIKDWTGDPNWVVYDAGAYLGTVNDRSFSKYTDGHAVAAFGFGCVGNWYGVWLASTKPENTYTIDYGIANNPGTIIEYAGLTWYCNHGRHYQNASGSSSSPLHIINEHFNSWEDGFTYMLQQANVRAVRDNGNGIPGDYVPLRN